MHDAGATVVRPGSRNRAMQRSVAAFVGFGLVVATVGYLATDDVAVLLTAALLLVPLVVVAGCVALYVAGARAVVTSDVVEKYWRGWRLARLDRRRLVGLTAEVYQYGNERIVWRRPGDRFRTVFLAERGEDGRARGSRVQLSGWYWSQEAILEVSLALGVAVVAERLTARECEARAPGVLPLRYRRQVTWAFLVVVGGLVGVVVLVGVWAAAMGGL